MMKKHATGLLTWLILVVLFAMLPGCAQQQNVDGTSPSAVASVSVAVGFNNSNVMAASRAPLGTINEVVSVKVEVYDNATPLVTGQCLTSVGGVWSATIAGLSTGKALTFRGHAFNSSSLEIFTGTAVQALSGINDSVVINMSVIDNGVSTALPKISGITVPAQVVTSGTATMSVSVEGGSNETLTYVITAATGGGIFTSSSGTIILSGSAATLTIGYTAPSTAGTYTHTVKISNSQGNIVETSFVTTVVASIANGSTSVQFAPVVTHLSAKRTGSNVVWTATVVDDGPAGELRYNWSFNDGLSFFDGGLSFFDSTVNPATLEGYSQSSSGTLALTVKDHNGTGGSTTITYALPVGQFPDSLATTQTTTSSSAPSFKVPDTGQTLFYSMNYGDDSDYRVNPMSFTDNGNGTITDNVTELLWQNMGNAIGTWDDANAYCSSLNLGGYSTGWRLPNGFELMSIVNYGTYSPAIDATYFPNTGFTYLYWSSEIVSMPTFSPAPPAPIPPMSWSLNFMSGTLSPIMTDNVMNGYIRCVHGAQAVPILTDNGNNTVTDQTTKLMWQKQDDGTLKTWDDAISYCEGLSLGGYTDWRMPNIKELSFMMGRATQVPAEPIVDGSHLFFWSSTTDASQTGNALLADFMGAVGLFSNCGPAIPPAVTGNKSCSTGSPVRCVRAGATDALPAKPSGVTATSGSAGSGSITLSWNTVPGATSYRVYCGTMAGVTRWHWGLLPEITASPVTVVGTGASPIGFNPMPAQPCSSAPGVTNYFVVTAVNATGESDESIQVWAVVP